MEEAFRWSEGFPGMEHVAGVVLPDVSASMRSGQKSRALALVCWAALVFAGLSGPCLAAGGVELTPISQIQGRGARSVFEGQRLSTQGVVSVLSSAGFFMQDERGDADPLSSDGIYVHLGRAPQVKPGDRVRVQARVAEYVVGSSAQALANPLTELVQASVRVLASGLELKPLRIAFPPATEADLERYEGMLVELPGPLTVVQNFFLGRYGQLSLAAGARLARPTGRFAAGSAEARALAAENARRRIILDDASSRQNPDSVVYLATAQHVRAGDQLRGVVGALDYGLASSDPAGLASYRIQAAQAPVFTSGNPRRARPPEVGGDLRLGSFNLLNYFTTLDQPGAACYPGGGRSDCRGADSEAEFLRQKHKIVEALLALDADVLGLIEIENRAEAAVDDLVAGLNARLGGPVYASVGAPEGGSGRDAIRVAMIYKPAKIQRVGPARSDPAALHGRAPLAQVFQAAGQRFSVVLAHLKSKSRCPQEAGSADADQGDGQGCWNARRVAQARALSSFMREIQARSGSEDVLLLGDLNAYAQEDPLLELRAQGMVDLLARFALQTYSYIFDGEAGYLDHALANSTLAGRVTGAAHWHINADEPPFLDYNLEYRQPACARCARDAYQPDVFRSSDHDPLLLGLRLGPG